MPTLDQIRIFTFLDFLNTSKEKFDILYPQYVVTEYCTPFNNDSSSVADLFQVIEKGDKTRWQDFRDLTFLALILKLRNECQVDLNSWNIKESKKFLANIRSKSEKEIAEDLEFLTSTYSKLLELYPSGSTTLHSVDVILGFETAERYYDESSRCW